MNGGMSVGDTAALAGVTVRTLHHYDTDRAAVAVRADGGRLPAVLARRPSGSRPGWRST